MRHLHILSKKQQKKQFTGQRTPWFLAMSVQYARVLGMAMRPIYTKSGMQEFLSTCFARQCMREHDGKDATNKQLSHCA